MVVPIFAPMIMGTASTKVIEPEATAVTIILVLVELLCIRAVISSPIKRPINGLDDANMIDSTVLLLRCLKESLIRSRANKNIIMDRMANPIRIIVELQKIFVPEVKFSKSTKAS